MLNQVNRKWVVAPRVSDDLYRQILHNRGIKDETEVNQFLNPPHPQEIADHYRLYLKKIDPQELEKALALIKRAVAERQTIIIHGDYDVDGICSTAILNRTLRQSGARVITFIPDRFNEGYGLSRKSLEKIKQLAGSLNKKPLLITTDCGITAVDEVKFAKSQGFNVIITDHHAPKKVLPPADAIIWTDQMTATGIAWLLAEKIKNAANSEVLALVALATVADMQPLLKINRSLVKYGLMELNRTQNPGLRELIKVSGLEGKEIGTYEVSWMLAPRLNAAGRLENAQASLKLLTTDDVGEAQNLAIKLNQINSQRQQITLAALEEARQQHQNKLNYERTKIIILSHEEWHEGIIGLVAGRLKEEFYRPAIVIAQGKDTSKGSARSISGFNIIEAIRACGEHLVDAGGHALAAGFTIRTAKIFEFHEKITALTEKSLEPEALDPILNIDARLRPTSINWKVLKDLKKFEPFGIGNPRPTFLTEGLQVDSIRAVGRENKHLRLWLKGPRGSFSVIGFNRGAMAKEIYPGDMVDIVYTLEENLWNGQRYLQLNLKDLRRQL